MTQRSHGYPAGLKKYGETGQVLQKQFHVQSGKEKQEEREKQVRRQEQEEQEEREKPREIKRNQEKLKKLTKLKNTKLNTNSDTTESLEHKVSGIATELILRLCSSDFSTIFSGSQSAD